VNSCPNIAEWERFSQEACDAARAEGLRAHLNQCSSCRELLDRIRRNDQWLGSIRPLWGLAPSDDAGVPVGRKIGAFTVSGVLGSGGMATVYRARQDFPRREVALKVIRAGLATRASLRRLELEAELLGRLIHPGIAQIYEAGVADIGGSRQPFFAMELVEGERLTDFAERRNLDFRDRLELMMKVGEAVHYAHQKGIIHRDLKPSNILVIEGASPKILDFGVARSTDTDLQTTTLHTSLGQLIGTLPYMSPEQAAGDPNEIDIRSDVYALGVITYEMLSGRLPYDLKDKSVVETVRVIREEEPPSLGTINSLFRGDPATIVAKALEKDKMRRYSSASAFVADLRCFLNDEPIAARPPSATYQLAKFARRNRTLVGGVAAVFAVLVLGLAGTGYGLIRATAERNRAVDAEQAARIGKEQAESVISLLKRMLSSADPEQVKGADYTVRQLLDEFDQGLQGQSIGPREVEATIRATIGNAYLGLGLREQAERQLKASLELRRQTHGPEHLEVARSLCDYAWFHRNNADYSASEAVYREALDMQRKLLGSKHTEIATTLNRLSDVLRYQGQLVAAETMAREALAMRRELLGSAHPDVASDLKNLGWVLLSASKNEEAETVLREALATGRMGHGNHHPFVADGLHALAQVLGNSGNAIAADSTFQEALAVGRQVLGETHHDVGAILASYGWFLCKRSMFEEAEPPLRDAVAIARSVHGNSHPCLAHHVNCLGILYGWSGDFDRAEPQYRESLAMFLVHRGEEHSSTQLVRCNLADILIPMGQTAEALELARSALSNYQKLHGENHVQTANAKRLAGLALVHLGQVPDGELLLRQSVETYRELSKMAAWPVARAESALGECLRILGRFEEAESLLLRGYRTLLVDKGPKFYATMTTRQGLISLYDAWGKPEQAAEFRSEPTAEAEPVLVQREMELVPR